MGCLFSGPLQKTNGNQVSSNYTNYTINGSFAPNEFNPNDGGGENNENEQKFFSFSEFIQQNAKPMIFEYLFYKDEIGKGAMSRVYLCQNTETSESCAAKVYNQSLLNRQNLGNEEPPILAVKREIDIMTSLSHRYILPIVEVIDDNCTNSLIIILPFAPEGTLQSYVDRKKPDEKTFQICFFELAESLRYAHENNVVHRDLKPDNLLVFSDTLFKLSDFSVSTKVSGDDEQLSDTRGSPAFLSPEECATKSFFPKPADVWAYGVTLFGCIYGFLPFNLDKAQGKSVANTIFAVAQLLNTEELEVPEDKGFSPHLSELLKQILQKDPSKRPTFAEIVKSPWFDGLSELDKENEEEFQKFAELMRGEEEEEEEAEEPKDNNEK